MCQIKGSFSIFYFISSHSLGRCNNFIHHALYIGYVQQNAAISTANYSPMETTQDFRTCLDVSSCYFSSGSSIYSCSEKSSQYLISITAMLGIYHIVAWIRRPATLTTYLNSSFTIFKIRKKKKHRVTIFEDSFL